MKFTGISDDQLGQVGRMKFVPLVALAFRGSRQDRIKFVAQFGFCPFRPITSENTEKARLGCSSRPLLDDPNHHAVVLRDRASAATVEPPMPQQNHRFTRRHRLSSF